MRKNVKQQLALRVLSTAALMAMVSSIATAAFAEEYNVAKGSVEIVAEEGSQYITQRDDTGTFVQDEQGKIDHREDSKIVLVTKDETTGETKPTSNTVTITAKDGNTANVTLQDVFINREKASDSDAKAALTVKGDGKTNIELNGNNTLSSTGAHAGLEKTDAECSGTLTITDDKNDDGSEKEEKDKYGYSTGGDTGTLAVIGGGQGGASIGGQGRMNRWDSSSDPGTEEDHSTSNITITGGTIRAGYTPDGCNYNYHWNTGAGIGGGAEVGGNGTNITITGNADVDAYGSYYAAGIGGAGYGSKKGEDGKRYHAGGNGENITISGNAKVTAQGWDAAGIGGGGFGLGKNIQIKDNADVSAIGGTCCAGIGGGEHYGGEVSISGNATVFAKAGDRGAGIGSGNFNGTNVSPELMDTTVTISNNATVTAIGSSGAAIGNGWDHRNLGKTDIIITGGTVNAVSGSFSPAIGGSNDMDDGHPAQNVTVTINGTTGNTTVNASCIKDVEHAISKGNNTADIIGYDADGVSPFGEDHSVVVRMYKKGALTLKDYDRNTHRYNSIDYNHGELYQTVHNPYDKAKFEVSAHNFIDMSEDGYGLSILNDCKYGFEVDGQRMIITLLKAPMNPDPQSDRGDHYFTYSLYPHAGNWKDAETLVRGLELNNRFDVKELPEGNGVFEKSFMSVNGKNVTLEAVKKCEDSDAFIVRFVEKSGRRTNVGFTFFADIKEAFECDLLERNDVPVNSFGGNSLNFEIKPFEIKCFKLKI